MSLDFDYSSTTDMQKSIPNEDGASEHHFEI